MLCMFQSRFQHSIVFHAQLTLQLSIVEEWQFANYLLDCIASGQTKQCLKGDAIQVRVQDGSTPPDQGNHIVSHWGLLTLQARALMASASVIGVWIISSLSSTWNEEKIQWFSFAPDKQCIYIHAMAKQWKPSVTTESSTWYHDSIVSSDTLPHLEKQFLPIFLIHLLLDTATQNATNSTAQLWKTKYKHLVGPTLQYTAGSSLHSHVPVLNNLPPGSWLDLPLPDVMILQL